MSGAVGVLDGQFELLDKIGTVETALLPDVQQPLHVLPAALICFPIHIHTHTDIIKWRNMRLNRERQKQVQVIKRNNV